MPRSWTLTGEQVLALPLDELALEVLSDAAENREWNSRNWFMRMRDAYPRQREVVLALAEAWQWLRSKGLVAHNLEQTSEQAIFITRLGHRVLAEGLAVVRAAERLAVDLQPQLERRVRRQFLMGEYELAAFASMKAVEVRVRELAGAPDALIGVKLMTEAFKESGALIDPALEPGERVARMQLFAGAMGVFKNPSSHREVEFDDPTEAAEVVLLADLLLRILNRLDPSRSSGSP